MRPWLTICPRVTSSADGSLHDQLAILDREFHVTTLGDLAADSGVYAVENALGSGGLVVGLRNAASIRSQIGDFDDNGVVNGADLGFLLSGWGTSNGDLNGDGVVNGADLGAILAVWGPCP